MCQAIGAMVAMTNAVNNMDANDKLREIVL